MRQMRLASLLLLPLLIGSACSAASPTLVPTPMPSPSPTRGPSSPPPTASPATPFTIDVLPAEMPTANRQAIPGGKYAFLVVVGSAGDAPAPVTIEAKAVKAKIVEPLLTSLKPGVVGEIWVVADPTNDEAAGSLTITATRSGMTKTETRTIPIFPMKDERAKDAKPYVARWIAWLAVNHPELGITAKTVFEPVFVSTLLVVSHYSYWSADWEMMVAWHNMIPPYDWTEVHLRRRGVDTAPSLAFKINSVSANTPGYAVPPLDSVVR